MRTHCAVLVGGTHDGTILPVDDDTDAYLYDNVFEPELTYRRTAEVRTIDGIPHAVFRLTA
ncbi:hypothetical protein [Streptomyces sp. XC 2026]|uniref:hypothetical protein n=1 Tax=Streptomyces sp. XC 2026 TaxID=2782004 RepID=UPI001903C5A1|nr:hypothetical protein [Streptomyces sp. XC 2026]QQN79698.1 hypothetical protein IPZ77_21455 [Streptomyces sp. XC 2026]QQN80604.1 hypothetical protein IPZ77_26720 [Streptomyces sp. XC 2026]